MKLESKKKITVWCLFAFKKNKQLTLNFRMGLFPQFVIVMFNMYPHFVTIASTPPFALSVLYLIEYLPTCVSQYCWYTVIENHLNAKEIWSGHGIQA